MSLTYAQLEAMAYKIRDTATQLRAGKTVDKIEMAEVLEALAKTLDAIELAEN